MSGEHPQQGCGLLAPCSCPSQAFPSRGSSPPRSYQPFSQGSKPPSTLFLTSQGFLQLHCACVLPGRDL